MDAKLYAFGLLVTGLLVGCTPDGQSNSESDVAAIEGVWEEYVASVNAGDAKRWASVWAEDAIQLQTGEAPVVGKQQIGERLGAYMTEFTIDETVTIAETKVVDNWAFSRGTFIAAWNPKGEGQPFRLDGTFMSILLRQPDGSWKIYRDISNYQVAAGGE